MVFNERWIDYRSSVIYRDHGAAEVDKVGSVACLIGSVTPFSIYSPPSLGGKIMNKVSLFLVALTLKFWELSCLGQGGGWMGLDGVAMI